MGGAGAREWGSLGQGQQLAAVLMLARLAQESGAARTQLAEADATRREERKQLDDLRKQAKRYGFTSPSHPLVPALCVFSF